ncbi:MAG TPA: DUF4334 domain-containing protein [Dongiaceae bacterium]|nr:DUF4334 domain-containing protein [Dongiaceae bacterium]
MTATAHFIQLRDATQVDSAALEAFFDQLPAAEESFMLGEWRGGCFRSGHPGEAMLTQLQWRGKRFSSRTDVSPLLCADAQGNIVVNGMLGSAQLREVVYRGVCTATMIYDSQPILDHFRKIDDKTVLGAMDRKGDAAPLYFYLQRLSD